MKVEYQVRPVTRYIVTRYYDGQSTDGNIAGSLMNKSSGGCEQKGEFPSYEVAYSVGYALAKEEHERLGYAIGDDRIKYPKANESPVG